MLRMFDSVVIKFGYSEINSVTDFLAKNEASLNLNKKMLFCYETPCLKQLLLYDLSTVLGRCTSKNLGRLVLEV